MKRDFKTSVSTSKCVRDLWDEICKQKGKSRSEVLTHLIIFYGLTGGDMPLTTRILSLPERDQDRLINEIRRKVEKGESARPQKFRQWMIEALSNEDPEALENGADALLRRLISGE